MVCGLRFLYDNNRIPFIQFFLPESPVPMLDSELVLITLGGLLGMGSLRTYEKYKGVERKRLDDY